MDGVDESTHIARILHHSSVNSVFDDFAETVRASRDDRQTRGQCFEARVRKWIVECWQYENVGGGIKRGQVAHYAEKMRATRFVFSLIAAAGHE